MALAGPLARRTAELRIDSTRNYEASRTDALTGVVTVDNEGHPIDASKLNDIFDPFRQGEPDLGKPRDLRSAGLGLYIVRAIVTAHDGTIDVASSPIRPASSEPSASRARKSRRR